MNVTFWVADTSTGRDKINKVKIGECNIENGRRPVWIHGDEKSCLAGIEAREFALGHKFNKRSLSDWRQILPMMNGSFHWVEVVDES